MACSFGGHGIVGRSRRSGARGSSLEIEVVGTWDIGGPMLETGQ